MRKASRPASARKGSSVTRCSSNWLHLIMAVAMLGLGFALRGRGTRRAM